jgi:hypothetical protein
MLQIRNLLSIFRNHVDGSWGQKSGIRNATWPTCWSSWSLSSFAAILDANKGYHKGVWPRCRLQSRAGNSVCKGWEYPLPLYVQSFIRKRARGLITCCVKSNAGSPDVERCKHIKSQATTVYFKLGKLRRVSTYVQHMWGIIGHVTAEAGNTVGTDGAPPQYFLFLTWE